MNKQFSESDKKWQTYNKKLIEYMKNNDFFMLGTTYYEMAYFLKSEDKKYQHLLDMGYEMKRKAQIEFAKQQLSSGVVIELELLATADSCEACKQIEGTIIPILEAIKNPPLPVKKCTFEPYGCRCIYLPVVEGSP